MNIIATAICLPGEIKSFSQGEKESTATTAVSAKTWNHLLEELENFKAKVACLEQEYATYREQSQKEILFLKEKTASQNAKIAALEMAVTGQDNKITILETGHGRKKGPSSKEETDHQNTKIDILEAATTNAKIVILESAVASQDKKIAALEADHDKDIERLALEAAYDRQRLAKVETKNVKCENDSHSPPGKKTESRIEKVKSILKRCCGAQTFQQLQKDLTISPSQFTRLVSYLDKRSFEVFRRAGGKHGEKVLKLRVRIMEGTVFT